VTATPSPGGPRPAPAQGRLPVIDYAAWRTEHGLFPGDAFDVYGLRTWLEAGLKEIA